LYILQSLGSSVIVVVMSLRSCLAHGIPKILKPLSLHQPILPFGKCGLCSADAFREANFRGHSIWDAEDKRKQKTVIVVKSKDRGGRTKVSACGYSQDGNYIGGGEFYISRKAGRSLMLG
jgi:hypothetical protein